MDFDEAVDHDEGGEPNYGVQEEFYFGMDEQDIQDFKSLKDSVLFLIDCRPSMLQKNPLNEGGNSNVNTVLSAVVSFMKTKIITSENDKVGIVLYGCKQSQNSLNFPQICVMYSLETPDAKMIKNLNSIIEKDSFAQVYGSGSKETPLYEALWICHTEFKGIEKQSFNRRIFLFTNEDAPSSGNKNDQVRAIQRAHDLSELNVTIELFPMVKPGAKADQSSFDIKKFYADLISLDEDEISTMADMEATSTRITELMKRIRQKEYRKRTLGKCLFALSPKMQIAMRFFNMVHEAKKPNAVFVHAESNKPLKSTTRWICEESASILYENQIGTHAELGGEKVNMKKEDIKKIKSFDKVGMTLMGFKPRSELKDHYNIRASYFVYPDDQRVVNSSQVVNSLIKKMIQKDKVAIVRFTPRDQSIVRFCALLPQAESYDPEDNFQTPPGFQLVYLPYADDMRNAQTVTPAKGEEPDAELVSKAKLMIKNLTLDFDSRQFENPALQKFYSSLQALALNEKAPEQFEDLINPDAEGLDKFKDVISNFAKMSFGENYVPQKLAVKKPQAQGKRPAASRMKDLEEEKEEKKKSTVKNGRSNNNEEEKNAYDNLDDDKELKEQLESGELERMTVAQLKEILGERKLSVKGRKPELLETLVQYLTK